MALSRKIESEIPYDAIRLTASEAIEYQWKTIHEWTPETDVWPLKYGFALLGTLSGASAFFINNHYRHRLRLREFGRFSSYFPIVVIPTLMSCFFHQQLVTSRILLQNDCSVCTEVRSGVIQVAMSTVYPLILAPIASFHYANRYNTYKVPSIVDEPRKLFQLWQRFTKSLKTPLSYAVAIQILGSMALTYLETNSFYNVQNQLNKLESELSQKFQLVEKS